jgi:DNA primase
MIHAIFISEFQKTLIRSIVDITQAKSVFRIYRNIHARPPGGENPMERYIPDEIIEQIRARCDIVDLIGSYVPLKKAGNAWKALCPFHQEKTPSFNVNPQRHSFHCFGCGKGGDIFRFVMEKENVDFPTAVQLIASRYQIHIPSSSAPRRPGEKEAPSGEQKDRIYQVIESVCSWFQSNLRNPDSPVRSYLDRRGIPMEIAAQFQIGAAPDSWDAAINYCKSRGFTDREILTAGIAKENEQTPGRMYDRFRNRLTFAIWNEQGKVVAFSARSIDPGSKEAKYINSPETPLFTKSRILYALPKARQAIQAHGFAILCEGQLDVIAMHRAGFQNTIAPQGTAFTEEQARLLKRYTERVYLAFDADSAGTNAIIKAFDLAAHSGLDARVIVFPKGSDPDDLFRNHGPEKIREIVEKPKDFIDYLIELRKEPLDGGSTWDVGRTVATLLEHVAKIDNSIIRADSCRRIAAKVSLPEEVIYQELNKLRRRESIRGSSLRIPQTASTQAADPFSGHGSIHLRQRIEAELILLELALSHGTVGKRLEQELEPGLLTDQPSGRALETVIRMTLEGEWERSSDAILAMFSNAPDPAISRILTAPNTYDHEQQEKAIDDCIRTIRQSILKVDIERLTKELRGDGDPAGKQAILEEFQKKTMALGNLSGNGGPRSS